MIKDDNTSQFLNALDEAVARALETIGMKCERYAKIELDNTPRRIDTGLLRNSITHALFGKPPAITSYHADTGDGSGKYSGTAENKKDTVFIGTNVEYAQYVHFGTTRMTKNEFIKNAVDRHMDEYKEIVKSEMKK